VVVTSSAVRIASTGNLRTLPTTTAKSTASRPSISGTSIIKHFPDTIFLLIGSPGSNSKCGYKGAFYPKNRI
jgi:hypothetical protein